MGTLRKMQICKYSFRPIGGTPYLPGRSRRSGNLGEIIHDWHACQTTFYFSSEWIKNACREKKRVDNKKFRIANQTAHQIKPDFPTSREIFASFAKIRIARTSETRASGESTRISTGIEFFVVLFRCKSDWRSSGGRKKELERRFASDIFPSRRSECGHHLHFQNAL